MKQHFAIAIALPWLLAAPTFGQDFLGPIKDIVEQLSPDKPPAPKPAPPVAERADTVVPPVPRPRPEPLEPEPAETVEQAPDARVYQAACPAVMLGLVEAAMSPPLSEEQCGEQSPLVVTGVLSRGRMIALSSPITTNCQMASALPAWVAMVDGYAEAMLGSRLSAINTGTSYMCRKRNNGAAGFTSEHGFANAVDITGFALEDGQSIAVTQNWLPPVEPEGRLLRLAHDAACAGFTTVLGPEANAEHADHLHLDLGCHGASCTARICE